MGAILDLWKSERGIVAVALIAAATMLCGLGVIAVDQWLDYTKWIFVTYAAAKTVTGAVGIASAQPKTPPAVWQQIEPLITSIVARMATERAATRPEPPPGPSPVATVAIVPPPKAG
jgi:hypothetical protein